MAASSEPVTACFIIIGNEILSGRTRDANLPYLAEWLNRLGIQLREARVVPDLESAIIEAVNESRARFDYVFTSGGIGPTHDDITSASVAKAFGTELELNAEAHAVLATHYAEGELNEARLGMARIPKGATLIDNPISKAPGFQIENVFVLAGIPVIFEAMLESLRHRLVGGDPVLSRTIGATLPEGVLAEPLAELQRAYPQVDMGSYPFYRAGRFGLSIVLRATDKVALDGAAEELKAVMRGLDAEPWEGEAT